MFECKLNPHIFRVLVTKWVNVRARLAPKVNSDCITPRYCMKGLAITYEKPPAPQQYIYRVVFLLVLPKSGYVPGLVVKSEKKSWSMGFYRGI